MGLSYIATNPEGQRWVITRENTESVDDTDTNTANTKKNEAYQNVVNIANNTVGKDYKTQRKSIKQLDVDEATKTKLENSFDIFYIVRYKK